MKHTRFLAIGALGLVLACKPVTVPTAGDVEAGIAIGTGICSLLEGVDETGVLRTICATAEEVASLIAFVLTLRSAADAGPALAPLPCTPLPGTAGFCTTSAERAKGIAFLVRVRSARLLVDAGKDAR